MTATLEWPILGPGLFYDYITIFYARYAGLSSFTPRTLILMLIALVGV